MSSLKFTLFGSPQGKLNGECVAFTTRKSLALFVYVMLTKQSHTRETLATLFWPDFSADRAFANLRWTLQSLKHNLSDEWFDIRRHEVAIKEHPGLWVDVHEFERQLEQGRDHEHGPATACAACLPALLAAIEIYRGDFLCGFTLPDCPAFDEWQAPQTDRYREHLINGFTQVVQYLASQHDFPQAIAYALRWVGVCPYSEAAHRELMRVYALNHHRSAALQQYQTCTQMLWDEFGAKPDYETQALYEAIVKDNLTPQPPLLKGEGEQSSLSLWARVGVRAKKSGGEVPNNLPAQTTSFIGRETEVAAVSRLLSQPGIRLVTLTGAGGSGKTRLGLQVVAHLLEQYADGVFFVSLAPISNPDLVIPTILQTLGLKATGSASPLDVLKAYVQKKSLLLVLDNFEQILEAAPVLIDVLAAAPDLNMLVTSRVVLHLSGGHEYLVPPLEVPDLLRLPSFERLTQSEAVRLFAERAQAVYPDFTLTEETTPIVAEICVRLDGLPLAIELAAARIRMFTLQEICSRLGHRLQFLTGGARDLPARQHTIRATIVWSYELLDDAGKTLFRRLGVFVGGWTLDAAERICAFHDDPSALRQALRQAQDTTQDIAGSGQALDVFSGLESLMDHNLIVHDEQEGQSRFSMLETVREYAVERLLESGEADAMRQRHARVFMELAEDAEPEFFGVDPVVWIQRVEREHNNLRAALAWAIDRAPEVGLRLAGALRTFWHVRSYQREGREWVEKALAKSQDAEPDLEQFRAKALHCLGWLAIFQGDSTTAHTVGEDSVALWRTVGDTGGLAQALLGCGVAMFLHKDFARASLLLEESITLFRQIKDQFRLAEALGWYGMLAYSNRDYERAYTSAMEGRSLAQEIGSRTHVAATAYTLGLIAFDQGDYATAQNFFEECISLYREIQDEVGLSDLVWLGRVLGKQQRYEQAKACYEEYLELAQKMGNQLWCARAYYELGYLALHQQHWQEAAAHFAESLARFREQEETHGMALCLAGWAGVAVHYAQPDRAARLLGSAAVLLETPGRLFDETLAQARYESIVTIVRSALGEEAFAAALAKGREMTLGQAIEYALGGQPCQPPERIFP